MVVPWTGLWAMTGMWVTWPTTTVLDEVLPRPLPEERRLREFQPCCRKEFAALSDPPPTAELWVLGAEGFPFDAVYRLDLLSLLPLGDDFEHRRHFGNQECLLTNFLYSLRTFSF